MPVTHRGTAAAPMSVWRRDPPSSVGCSDDNRRVCGGRVKVKCGDVMKGDDTVQLVVFTPR